MSLSTQAAENDKPRKAAGTSKSVGNGKSAAKPSGQAKAAGNAKNSPKATNKTRKVVKASAQDTRVSHGRLAGLHQGGDDLDLRSSGAGN